MVHVQTGNMLDVVVEGKSIGLKPRGSNDVLWLPEPEGLVSVLSAEIKRLRPAAAPPQEIEELRAQNHNLRLNYKQVTGDLVRATDEIVHLKAAASYAEIPKCIQCGQLMSPHCVDCQPHPAPAAPPQDEQADFAKYQEGYKEGYDAALRDVINRSMAEKLADTPVSPPQQEIKELREQNHNLRLNYKRVADDL